MHGVLARDTFFGRHTPQRGGRRDHHVTSCRSRISQRVEMPANAGGAVGVLVTVFLVANGLDQFDLVPVGFHLVGDDLRQRRTDALPHFRAVTVDFDDAVVANIDVNVGRHRRGGFRGRSDGFLLGLAGGAERQCKHQPATGLARALHEFPAADLFDVLHD